MYTKSLSIAFTFVLAVMSSAYAQDYGNPSKKISDPDLYEKIQEKIGQGSLNFQVYNGIVTLNGSVQTLEDKEKIEKSVQQLDGIRVIMNQIIVTDSDRNDNSNISNKGKSTLKAYGVASDDRLNLKILDLISDGTFGDKDYYSNVSLVISNGTVTLEGSVKTSNDQQILISNIQSVKGVKAVKSNLSISSE